MDGMFWCITVSGREGELGGVGGCPTDTIVESNSANRLSSLCVSLDGRKAKDEDDAQ